MGTTAVKLIESAARKVGILGSGEHFPPEDMFDAMISLKQMFDGWSLEKLMIPYITREDFALDGSGSYTIGIGGDFDTVLPLDITKLVILTAKGENYFIKQVNLDVWARIGSTSITGRPQAFYYEAGYPVGTIYFTGMPTDPTVRIWSHKPIEAWQIEDVDITNNPAFSGQKFPTSSLTNETLSADIEFDVGYESAIIYNLAIHLCPEFGASPTDLIIAMATKYKALIKRKNYTEMISQIDAGLGVSGTNYDITSGP